MKRKLVSFDWAMKKLLRSKANFVILEGFLSELLFEDIKIIEILESESNKEEDTSKYNRVDIKVKNSKNEIILIEIQHSRQLDYFQRMLYGTSKVITEHIKSGSPYADIVKVISINIIYFDLGIGEDYIYIGRTTFKGMHKKDTLKLSKEQKELLGKKEVEQIFPQYYIINVNRFDDLAKDSLDEWIYFLKNEEIKGEFKAKGLKEAKEKLDYMKLPKRLREKYDEFEESIRELASLWLSNYKAGEEEGIKKGIQQGIRQGEKQKSYEIAKNLLKNGVSVDIIIESTGLTKEEIEKLKK